MTTKPHPKESVYFTLRVVFSLLAVLALMWGLSSLMPYLAVTLVASLVTLVLYVALFVVYFALMHVFLIGHLRGNGVQVTAAQFPEVYAMVQEVSTALGLKKAPPVFLVQAGGVLNAFATRLAGRDYVALYSDVVATVEQQPEVLKFILAHELTHVRRRHVQKRFWTLLSFYVPFLGSAYSRACEHTCDAFAAELVPTGATPGLLLLAAGKDLYRKVSLEQYLASFDANNTAVVRFAGIFASHPHLPVRLRYLANTGAQA